MILFRFGNHFLQTVYMEVLNLQSRPKYSLIDLEKRLTVVKQEFIKKSSKATTIIDSSTGSIPSSSTSTRSSVAQSQASATSEIKTSEIKASASSDPSSLTASFSKLSPHFSFSVKAYYA